MPQARFKSYIGSPVIDEENGVIRGCRIATLGAKSQSKDGEGRGLIMDEHTISALLALALEADSSIPAFFTHSWYDSEDDALNSDTGTWKNHSIVDGHLIADWHAFDTPYKAGIFSRAKVDPRSIAISPIFDYTLREGSTSLCNPVKFISADFVKSGAINKALLSEDIQTKPSMDISELLALLDDPKCKEAIKAIVKSHKGDDTTEDTASEEAAGVTEADKSSDDDTSPALMRSVRRIHRATIRQAKEIIATEKSAILSEASLKGEASATALLGKGGLLKAKEGQEHADKYTATLAKFKEVEPNEQKAVYMMLRKHPELMPAHELATRERMAKLVSAN
jgi:hypothetical protein